MTANGVYGTMDRNRVSPTKGEVMKALILHGNLPNDDAENAIHEMLCAALRAKGWETDTKALAQMRVGPCTGCFNCWFKTPGECRIDDDGREVARAVANCDALLLLSPVTFGGYSSRLKYAVDRMIPTISHLPGHRLADRAGRRQCRGLCPFGRPQRH
jgi:multimeric flavodoxin WrbA